MIISISDSSENSSHICDIETALSFFVKECLPQFIIDELLIEVKVIDDPDNLENGYLLPIDDETNVLPKHYEILLNLQSECIEQTIAHEVIHLSQYALGKLVQLIIEGSVIHIWDGQFHDKKSYEYRHIPWEIEAYTLDQLLYEKWITTQKF